MARNSHPATTGQIPDDLRETLQGVAKRHRTVRSSLAALRVLFVSLAVGLVVVLLLGEFTQMPLALRCVLALLVWVVPAGLCLHVLIPALRQVNMQAAADTMDAVRPQSHELFLSAVELAQKRQDPFVGSPQLVNHVINRAADDAHAVDPGRAVSADKLIRWAFLCGPLVLIWAILWPLMPQTLTLGVQRTVFPWMVATASPATGPRHSIKVEQGPVITFFEKRYVFPAYTRLPEKIVRGHNGAIHGLFGSRIQVIIHTTEPLAVGSQLVVNTSGNQPAKLPLTRYGPLAYAANLVLTHNATYAAVLVNQNGVKMAGKQAWPVTVDAVPPPTIHISTPALTVRVRPDDLVPVQFTATDIYGLSAIRALLWTGNSAVRTVNITLPGIPGKVIQSHWTISVPQQLPAAGRTVAPTIYYKLEALDCARPQAHIAITARHELIVDTHLQHSYLTRQDNKLSMSLRQAIVQALIAVKAGSAQARALVRWPMYRAVDPLRKAAVAGAAVRVVRAGRTLANQAKTMLANDFGAVATRAIGIVHGPMRAAANDLARTGLAADQAGRTRMPRLARASTVALQRTQASLLRLLHALDQAKARAALKNSLTRLARRQRSIAQMLSIRDSPQRAYHDQQALAQQLQQLLRQHPSLQNPVAQQMTRQLYQLAQKAASIAARQAAENMDLHPHLLQQAQQTALRHLANQQQLLNRQITRFNQRYKTAIAAAAAQPVTAAMMQTVSHALASPGNAAVAREGRNNIVKILQAMANQLNRYASQSDTPAARQQSRQVKQNQVTANQLSQQVQAAAATLQQEESAKSLHRAVQAADAIWRQARNMLNENPADQENQERADLLQARTDARHAVEQTMHGSGNTAESLLKQAYHQLAKATREQAAQLDTQKSLAQQATVAAMQARTLARRQTALAAQTAAAHKTPTPQAVESAQHQTANAIAEAIAQGQILQQQAMAGAPNLAQHLKAALTLMQRANTAQSQAAADQSAHDSAGSQAHQGQALAQMRMAGREIAALEHFGRMDTSWQHPAGADGREAGNVASGQTGPSQAGPPGANNSSADTDPGRASQASLGTMAAVARHVQAAVASQPQALVGSAGAAASAAQSLTMASTTLAGALAGQPSAMPGGHGKNPGANSTDPGYRASADQPGSNGTGISGPMPDTWAVPPQVTALGISPAQWEHLGPLQQLRLLNIARQRLPAGYRRTIRDYYLRIAALRAVKQ